MSWPLKISRDTSFHCHKLKSADFSSFTQFLPLPWPNPSRVPLQSRSVLSFDQQMEMISPRPYSCCNCRNRVSLHEDVVSKEFQGRHGRAFLFSRAMNVSVGPKVDRHLMTGLHTVADVYCSDCCEVLGWKYEKAYEETQKYKEGKFVLEKLKIVKENW